LTAKLKGEDFGTFLNKLARDITGVENAVTRLIDAEARERQGKDKLAAAHNALVEQRDKEAQAAREAAAAAEAAEAAKPKSKTERVEAAVQEDPTVQRALEARRAAEEAVRRAEGELDRRQRQLAAAHQAPRFSVRRTLGYAAGMALGLGREIPWMRGAPELRREAVPGAERRFSQAQATLRTAQLRLRKAMQMVDEAAERAQKTALQKERAQEEADKAALNRFRAAAGGVGGALAETGIGMGGSIVAGIKTGLMGILGAVGAVKVPPPRERPPTQVQTTMMSGLQGLLQQMAQQMTPAEREQLRLARDRNKTLQDIVKELRETAGAVWGGGGGA